MQTLIEFVKYTKGWEYIIAIASLLSFILFWRLAMKDRTQSPKKADHHEAQH
jgi:hypothetical protein